MARYLSAFGIAVAVTTGLFYLMQYLISGQHLAVNISERVNTVDLIRIKRAENTVTRQRKLPDPPKPPVIPSRPSLPVNTTSQPVPVAASFEMPLPGLPEVNFNRAIMSGVSPDAASPGENNEVIALLKVEPDYPRDAARQGKEGWVKLEFTVNEDGTVSDINVLDADPKRIFDKSAKRAITRWKFKPKMINGKTAKQRVIQVIEFKLNR